jgi:hypothetical protein
MNVANGDCLTVGPVCSIAGLSELSASPSVPRQIGHKRWPRQTWRTGSHEAEYRRLRAEALARANRYAAAVQGFSTAAAQMMECAAPEPEPRYRWRAKTAREPPKLLPAT